MDFEYILLDSLMRAGSFGSFEEIFKQAVMQVTGDDSTCIAAFYGFGSITRVQELLRPRFLEVSSLIRTLDSAVSEAEMMTDMARIWKDYKTATVFSCMRKQE